MNRRTALTVALAVLALVAVALAAATLDSATTSSGGGVGLGSGDGSGVGDDGVGPAGVDEGSGRPGGLPRPQVCFPVLNRPMVIAGVLGAFALLAYALYRETDTVFVPAAVVGVFGIPAYLLHALLTSCGAARPEGGSVFPALGPPGNRSVLPSGSGSTGLSDATGQLATPTLALGVLLVVALAGSVLLLFVSTGDDEETRSDAEPDPPVDTDVAAVGRAAGEAADRIEDDADVENEVYRAWREMTDHVAVPRPASSTPGDFAAAAVDAGMAREDVRELTALFEDVRYGGQVPTAEREARAVAALRRIEAAYAEIGGGDGTDGAPDSGSGGRTGGAR